MKEIEPRLSQAWPVMWLIIWRSTVGSMLGAFVFGFFIALMVGTVGNELGWSGTMIARTIRVLSILCAVTIGISWYCVVVKMALKKRYRHFRIALVSVDGN